MMNVARIPKVMSVLLGLIVVLSVGSCAKSTPTPAPTSTVTAAPASTPTATTTGAPTGPYGELKVAVSSFATERFYGPLAQADGARVMLVPLFDLMTGWSATGPTPAVIEKWTVAPDGLSWTYNVRHGVKWHNGQELTAKDIKFTFERYVAPDAIYSDFRQMVDRVEIVDDYAVRIYTKGTQPYLATLTGFGNATIPMLVLPKDYIDQNGKDYFERRPVGTGPFKFVSYVQGDSVRYEANTSYWGQVPDFKSVIMMKITEASTQLAALRTGIADIAEVSLDDVKAIEAAGFKTVALAQNMAAINFFGTYEPGAASMPTADVRVRQALTLAINAAEIRSTLFQGKAAPPIVGMLTANSNAADMDLPYWQSVAAKTYRYDPAEAKRLLAAAGYANGFSINLLTFPRVGAPYMPKVAEIAQAYWKNVGVNAQMMLIDVSVLAANRTAGPNRAPTPPLLGQALTQPHSEGYVAAKELARIFDSTQTIRLLGPNKDVDALLHNAQSETDPAKRKDMVARAMQVIMDSYTSIPVGAVPGLIATAPGIEVNLPTLPGSICQYLNLVRHGK